MKRMPGGFKRSLDYRMHSNGFQCMIFNGKFPDDSWDDIERCDSKG